MLFKLSVAWQLIPIFPNDPRRSRRRLTRKGAQQRRYTIVDIWAKNGAMAKLYTMTCQMENHI